MTAIYVLDGFQIRALDDFWRVVMDAFDGSGRQDFGRNLDAFADCLSGRPGHPDVDDFFAGMAESECEYIREKSLEGQASARERGRHGGRPKVSLQAASTDRPHADSRYS